MADDAFPGIARPTIVGVRDISYSIFDPDPDGEEAQSITYSAQVVWSDGRVEVRQGSLAPHLTAQEITGLQNLAARMRTKAEAAWGDAP